MSKSDQGGEKTSQKSNKSKLIAICGTVLLIAIIAILLYVIFKLMNRPEPGVITDDQGSRGTIVTPENVDELRAKISQPVEDGYYEVNMNTDWVFQTSTTPSDNAYVNNKETNNRTVYIDVILSDTQELVYSSPYIPVGSTLTDFALDTELAPGTYSATVQYHLVDDDNNEVTTLSVTVKLNILA